MAEKMERTQKKRDEKKEYQMLKPYLSLDKNDLFGIILMKLKNTFFLQLTKNNKLMNLKKII